jgi:AraC-like DNA-binding protein
MQVTMVAPSARLAPFVRRFTIVETDAEATRMLLPEHGLVLGIRFGGSASLVHADASATRVADATITGIVGAARRMRTSAGGGVVLAAFRETGAAQFFVEPLHELFGRTLSLDELIPRADLARVRAQIAGARDNAQRIAWLERFLIARVGRGASDPLVDAAVRAIHRARGSLRIAALARELGISQDPLEKRFRRTVGTSPKQLASLIRLRHAIDARMRIVGGGENASRGIDARRAGASWSRLAIEAGYFDQSHFIREFRAITGSAPTRFFRDTAYC